MSLDNKPKGKKIHTRNIEISTYDRGEGNILVEGRLKDDVLIPIYVSGEKRPPHMVHQMVIQLLIECSSLTIREITVTMPGIPYDYCRETADSLKAVKGLKIAPGFTSKVKKLLGESKKCLHLTTLLNAIVPAVMQGYWIYNGGEPDDDSISSDTIDNYLIDTCWVWRKDGPLIKRIREGENWPLE